MLFLSILLISMFVTMALIPILRAGAERFRCGLDMPDARKVHCVPVPKVGGLAMAVGALLPVLFIVDGGRFVNSVLLGAWIIVVFGVVDDFRNLGWKTKFLGQIIAALVVVLYGGLQICFLGAFLPEGARLSSAVGVPVTVLVVVGVTNAINLSDGLEGLAGGASLLIFLCILFLCYSVGDFPERFFIMLLCTAVIGVSEALLFARRRGFRTVVLIGHSFGGITSAAYAADHPDEVAALALCSAGGVGREYLLQGSRAGELASDRHAEVDAEARRLVAQGRGDQMIALPGWWYAITAASWVDLSENVPVTAESARRFPGPILALRGSKEPPENYPAEKVAEACGARATLVVIPGADHFYNGTQLELTRAVCDWLATIAR